MSDTHEELALTAVSVPFWEAAQIGELHLQKCDGCGRFIWYPRAMCSSCGSMSLTWTNTSGTGTVYAMSIHHRAPRPDLEQFLPYAILLVDLDEGVRMMARSSGNADEVTNGMRVRWRPDPTGGRAFLFESG